MHPCGLANQVEEEEELELGIGSLAANRKAAAVGGRNPAYMHI